METDFRRVVIIGYGKATGEILKYTADRRVDYGYGNLSSMSLTR